MTAKTADQAKSDKEPPLEISVIVPVRNAAAMIEPCLASIQGNHPKEIIIVDGRSTDGTVELARKYTDTIISDEGAGVARARQMGAEIATSSYVAFVDVDVEMPEDTLRRLLAEMRERGMDAIQAGLDSLDAGEYWSRALAAHHHGGRSQKWFGLSATVFTRETVLSHPFDASFRSGEDIEIRRRLEKAGVKAGVSRDVVVRHKFGPGFGFARDQWLADGAGLGRMVRKYGWGQAGLLAMPFGGGAFGIVRSLRREPAHIPYYLLYMAFNCVGIAGGLLDSQVRPTQERTSRS